MRAFCVQRILMLKYHIEWLTKKSKAVMQNDSSLVIASNEIIISYFWQHMNLFTAYAQPINPSANACETASVAS